VVRDAFDVALDEPPTPAVYSIINHPSGCTEGCNAVNYVIHLHRGSRETDLAGPVAREVRAGDGGGILQTFNTVGERLQGSIKDRSFALLVFGLFGLTAAVVCAAGLAGLTAFVVASRTQELAIRASLGASAGHLLRVVAGPMLSSTLVGILAGLVLAFWLSRWLSAFLYGLAPGDSPTLLLAVLLMLAVTAGSSVLPALRALSRPLVPAMRVE